MKSNELVADELSITELRNIFGSTVGEGVDEFGDFVGKVAQLPRIVSLHDFSITSTSAGKLTFSVVAKTYRYEGDTKKGAKK